MSRKAKSSIELLPPAAPSEAGIKRMIAQAVEQKVAEIMSGPDAIFEPYQRPRDISKAIISKQTVAEQNKWTYYYEEWGCEVCGEKEAGHFSLGKCHRCYSRTTHRLQRAIYNHAQAQEVPQTYIDTVKLAREALGPALKALPEKNAKGRRRTSGR